VDSTTTLRCRDLMASRHAPMRPTIHLNPAPCPTHTSCA
jgi:hypothetical protein